MQQIGFIKYLSGVCTFEFFDIIENEVIFGNFEDVAVFFRKLSEECQISFFVLSNSIDTNICNFSD